MPSAYDFRRLAKMDYLLCCKVEEDFPDDYAAFAAAYHIQQAVEKLLKALIMLHGEQPEFTHNIVKLAARCDALGIERPEELDDISDTLTLWESHSRYESIISFTEKKYEMAKQVYLQLDAKLETVMSGMERPTPQDFNPIG